jgi:hypothetical protein
MAQIVAVLSHQRPIFTVPRRPEGHGKIEAFNRYCRAAFVEEVKASSIRTLDGLNRAFTAWRDLEYNRRVHGETGQTPWDRWRAEPARIQTVSERQLTEAFLFRATRTTDKTGVLKLFGTRYQVGPELTRKKVEVRYDPERMDTVEVWHGTTFAERVQPLTVAPTRRPSAVQTDLPPDPTGPLVDVMADLVDRHRTLPVPDDPVQAALDAQRAHEDAIVGLVAQHLVPEVIDVDAVRDFVRRYGPLDTDHVADHLAFVVQTGGADLHIGTVLRSLRDALPGGQP